MRRVPFAKYEGLGNDFIVIDAAAGAIDAETARSLCDRHFGIGADGVLVVAPPESREAAGRMIVLNADGSRPEMCGNGLRCVALHLAGGRVSRALVVETDAGERACAVEGATVEIDMGPLRDEGTVELFVEGAMRKLARVSAGNPHAISLSSEGSTLRAAGEAVGAPPPGSGPRAPDPVLERLGRAIERAPQFPNGTNVEFATLADDGGIDLVVWERGVGFTLACGTGACATVGAACLRGARPFDAWIDVRLPGGTLAVRVAKGDLRATMRGPARRVFTGEVEIG